MPSLPAYATLTTDPTPGLPGLFCMAPHRLWALTPPADRKARVSAGFGVDLVKRTLTAGREMPPVRRLTAILAADVAGYSRLMGVDEEGTHERLQAHFRELVTPKINEHRGRIVKNTGDGFLAEFP